MRGILLKSAAAAAAAVLVLAVMTGCSKPPPINTEVNAIPAAATIRFKGKNIGETPVTLKVYSLNELMRITAALPAQNIIETRIHFKSQNEAEVTFRFGTEPSSLAQALGLKKVLVFDYSQNASFDTDQFTIKEVFKPIIARQAELLNTYFSTVQVYICGHTDEVGTSDYNLGLSLKRAQAVADLLVTHKVDKTRLKIQGFGETYPIASNDDEKGRALNRRTEIILPQ